MISFDKNKLASTSIAAVLLFGILYAINHTSFSAYIHPTSTKVSLEVQSHFQQKITEYEDFVWDLLKTDSQVSKEECFQKNEQRYEAYKKMQKENWEYKNSHYPALKPETVLFVQDILRDFDLNPADIKIVPYEGEGSPAAADDCTIFINEAEADQHSREAFKFVIAHEIAHLKVQDDSIYETLCMLTKTKKRIPTNKKQKALEAFRRFQETRADTMALLEGGKNYIQGAFDFLHKLYELNGGDNPGITHPKTSERIKNVQKIVSMMNWQVGETLIKTHRTA